MVILCLQPSIDVTDTPRKMKLKRQLAGFKYTLYRHKLLLKSLREKNRRQNKKICTLQTVLHDLKEKSLLNEENAEVLKKLNLTSKELCCRQLRNKKSSTKTKYSPALRTFALTLNYYSPKAYNYVRQKFDFSLPHPRTLRKWYESFDGNPGFTNESLNAIKMKVNSVDGPLYCCLMIDEMAIRRKVEWDGTNFHGYEDFGDSLHKKCDEVREAKEALDFLVTCNKRKL